LIKFNYCLAYQYSFWEPGNDDRVPCTIQLYSSSGLTSVSEYESTDSEKGFLAAVCISLSCPPSILEKLKAGTFKSIESVLAENFDKKLFRSEGIAISFIVLCIFILGVVTLAIYATIYDQFKPNSGANELLMSFSLKKRLSNLISLDQSKPADAISCLHGIRAISEIAIVYHHAYVFRIMTPSRDQTVFNKFLKTPMATVNGVLSFFVEPFFIISAMLFTRSMLKALDM